MIEFFIPLMSAFLDTTFLSMWFFPMIALAFIISVPCLIRQIFLGGR